MPMQTLMHGHRRTRGHPPTGGQERTRTFLLRPFLLSLPGPQAAESCGSSVSPLGENPPGNPLCPPGLPPGSVPVLPSPPECALQGLPGPASCPQPVRNGSHPSYNLQETGSCQQHRSLGVDPSPVEPSDETPALADPLQSCQRSCPRRFSPAVYQFPLETERINICYFKLGLQ